MKLKRLSFLSICVGALVLQACSHAPRPQEASWAEPVSGKSPSIGLNTQSLRVNGNMRKAGWSCR
jgi:hypothetical protein